MATSIADLLTVIGDEAPNSASSPRQASDAAGALSELGRALRYLATDGLEPAVRGEREQLVWELAESCADIAATAAAPQPGRLTLLASALADIVGSIRDETGRDQRRAIAVAVSDTVRILTTYAAEGSPVRVAEVVWAHQTARALAALGARDTLGQHARAMLERPIPAVVLPPELSAGRKALESLSVINDRLQRATYRLVRQPTLMEVLAVARAAESTTGYGARVGAAIAGQPTPDALPAAAIWHEIRYRMAPYTITARMRLDDHDLTVSAMDVHSKLRQQFGRQSDQLHVSKQAVQSLTAMVGQIPSIARNLHTAIERLADSGDLHAIASKLSYRPDRHAAFLRKMPIVADRFDLGYTLERVEHAETLAGALQADLDHSVSPVSRRSSAETTLFIRSTAAGERDPHRPFPSHEPADRVDSLSPDPHMAAVIDSSQESDVDLDIT